VLVRPKAYARAPSAVIYWVGNIVPHLWVLLHSFSHFLSVVPKLLWRLSRDAVLLCTPRHTGFRHPAVAGSTNGAS